MGERLQNKDVVKQTENKKLVLCEHSLVTDSVKPKSWSGENGEDQKSHLPVKLRRELW